jgi:hypothetical protein
MQMTVEALKALIDEQLSAQTEKGPTAPFSVLCADIPQEAIQCAQIMTAMQKRSEKGRSQRLLADAREYPY